MSRPARPLARRLAFLSITALALATVAVVAQSRAGGPDRVAWMDDVGAARRAAAAGHKGVLLDFTADWCPACQELHRTTWPDRAVAAAVAARCVAVQVDVDKQPDLARQYRTEYLPTLVLTDAAGREIRRSEGYLSPDEFRQWLAGGS